MPSSKSVKNPKSITKTPTSRGFFDFETYGWTPKDGEDTVRVNPLCCALVWGPPEKRERLWMKGKKSNPDLLPVMLLLAMREHQEVTEWWAHNAGKFDALFLCAAAARIGWELSGNVISSRTISLVFTCPKTKLKVCIYDTLNLVPSRLADIVKDFELKHAKIFTATDYSGDMRDLSEDKLRTGNLADCYVGLELLELLETMVEDWGGTLKKTFSSTALSIVKNNLESKGLKLPDFRKTPEVNQQAGNAYYGGRVEVFHHAPPWDLIELDRNSSYPAAMSENLPWDYLGDLSTKGAAQHLKAGSSVIIRATVTVPRQAIPPLPFKCSEHAQAVESSDDSIYFPVGEWQGWFTGDELRYAVSHCGVKAQPHEGMLFSTKSPFKEFIAQVYELKNTSSGAKRNFAKLLLNGPGAPLA